MASNVIYPKINFLPASLKTVNGVLDTIDNFKRGFGNEKLNLRPSYQRGEAWDVDFQEKLVYSLITNYPIGNFIFRSFNGADGDSATSEVVDGQQRLLTIYKLVRGEMVLSPSISRQIISENIEYFEYDFKNNINPLCIREYKKFLKDEKSNIKLVFKSLPSLIQSQILGYNLSVIQVTCSDEAIRQYFRFIQNQERLRAGEIINSIPDTPLKDYLDLIEDRQLFLNKIRWNESRKEFEKIFYSIIGVFSNSLYFGMTDNSIIEFVSSVSELDDFTIECTERMVNAINSVTRSNACNKHKFSKRLIKFFFLASGYGVIDFSNNTDKLFEKMCSLEEKLPVFNSGSDEDIKTMFQGFSESDILKHRELFLLGRGSHSPKDTRRVISYLRDFIY